MKITADTITDEQIRELRREAEGVSGNDVDIARLCYQALGEWHRGQDRHVVTQEARARCAEILNARAETQP